MEMSPGIHRSSISTLASVYFNGFVACLLLWSLVNRISILGLPLPGSISYQRHEISSDFLASFHQHCKFLYSFFFKWMFLNRVIIRSSIDKYHTIVIYQKKNKRILFLINNEDTIAGITHRSLLEKDHVTIQDCKNDS